jgi:acetyl esterase/lipase
MGKAYRDLAYVTNATEQQRLDLFLPDAPANALVVFIHGGAWISGDKSDVGGFVGHLNASGAAVASINYRLSTNPHIRVPTHVHDAAHAYAWLVHNAATYSLPIERTILMGHSVGAHTAGMLATGKFLKDVGVSSTQEPKGFVGLEGIYDVPNLVEKWPPYREWFVDKAFVSEKEWGPGSPARRNFVVKKPWMLIHSMQDELVDLGQTNGFATHLENQGIVHESIEGEFGTHDGSIERPPKEVLKDLDRFLSSSL